MSRCRTRTHGFIRQRSLVMCGSTGTNRAGLRRRLLVTTVSVLALMLAAATPVFADGGSGGGGGGTGTGGPGGVGGTDNATSTGGSGFPGSDSGGGGGGGAGTTGGSGASGGDDSCCSGGAGAGGSGGGSAGAEGHHGDKGNTGGGGGGGGGGAHGFVGSTLPTNNNNVRGGRGGQGGTGSEDPARDGGGGGGGGAGGYGAVVTGSGQLGTIGVNISGGTGGEGGAGGVQNSPQFTHSGFGGTGGTGGVGLQLSGTSQVIIHSRSIIAGGFGGDGGVGSNGSNAAGGGGGIGIFSASSSTITNDGTIKGGDGGAGGLGIISLSAGIGGTGGNGGDGVSLSGNGSSLINNRTITGGAGGLGGETTLDVGGVGGGGGNGVSVNGGTVTNNGTIQGGQGGQGGHGRVQTTSGNGGGGGSGALVTSGATLVNSNMISGGRGGAGGSGGTQGGNGSVGGTGVSVIGGTLINSGTINGGRGGSAGNGVDHDGSSGAGASGVSVTGGGTLINSGTIAAGGPQVDAVTFGAGPNLLELRAGSNIHGNVNATSGDNDALALGGSGSATFDVTKIGSKYLGFEGFDKTGSGTWTLTGSINAVTPWTISQGTLSISRDDNLGAVSGGLNFDGGGGENTTLRNTAAFTTARSIVLSSGTGTFDTAADLTLTGVISGAGSGGLVKTGNGTLTLTGTNTYLGGTTINAGTLSVSADANLGASIGGLSFNGGTLENTSAFATARTIVLGAAGGTFNTAADLTVTGAISGQGGLTKTGVGTLTLAGNIAYTGNTTIAAGTLAFDSSDTLVYGGAISGTGALAKFGTGTLTLTGASTYTGNTTINAGALNVAGSLGASAVTIANGATLIGSGSIGGAVTVQNGGSLNGARGPTLRSTLSMGALALNAGSTVNVVINSPGGALFDVGGDLTLAGTLNVVTTGGYGSGVYHLFEYDGSLTGPGLTIGSQPAGFMTSINTETNQYVNLVVYADPTKTQFWQGDSNPVGGSGIWSSTNPNWQNADSSASTFWSGVQGIFHGTPGTVTVEGPQTFSSLEFVVDGYNLVAGSGGALAPTGMAHLWAEGARTTATIATPITGAGGIVKVGAGTIVLTAANTYSGGTAIDAGTLVVSADNNLGDSSGGLTFNGGTLQNTAAFTTARAITLAANGGTFNTAADLTATGIISGAGVLTKIGAGMLTLTGANSYSGGTIIGAGTLRIGDGGTSGSIVGDVANNGVLAFDRSDDISYAGAVSGTGALAKHGAGRLTLTGTNTYTGGTTIAAGTLRVGDGGTSGSIVGNVANNGVLAFDRSDDLGYAGAVSGTGALAKYGAGKLTLAGTSTYTGGTTINAGTLSVSSDANLGAASGALIFNGGTLENTSAFTTARAITLAASGTFNAAADLTASGVISGPGALTKTGAGTLTLAGSNTYSGGTTIDAGTLRIGNGGTSGSILGDVVNNGVLAFDRSDDISYAGTVSSTGALAKYGAGRLTLTGTNTYAGGTTISAGTLRIGDGGTSGSIVGDVANNGVLAFDRSDDVNYAGVVSGTGALAKYGAGRLTITGTNTYTGGTVIDAGTLRIGDGGASGSIVGNVANNGVLAFDRSDDLSYAGAVSGTGTLAKYGVGKLILTGTSTYTGGTTINAGTLSVSSDRNLGAASGILIFNGGTLENTSAFTTARAITLAGGGTFNTAADLIASGVISGPGALTKTGTGTLTLVGTNTYTGGTIIDAGTLRIGHGGTSGSIVGDVVNNGVLAFDRSNNLTYDGAVSGTGALAKYGAGRLTLTGTHGYTGATTVDRGALIVNGSIAESILLTVNAGGLVGGTGILPATTINGGTLSPGNSIGTINVQGDLTFSTAASYLVDVSRVAADQVNVSGSAALGGTVRVVAAPDDYGPNTTYTILHADGGVSGTETLSAVGTAFLDPTLTFDANNVFLNLTLLPFSSAAWTPNQHAVAGALQAGGTNNALGAAVVNQATAVDARQAFDALSGEVHASVAGVLLDDSRYLRSAVLGRLRQAPYAEGPLAALGIGGPALAYEQPQSPVYAADFPVKAPSVAPPARSGDLTFWAQGYGAWGTFDGNGNAATIDRSLGGALVGLDSGLADGWRVGFAAGYSQSSLKIGARASSATVDSGHVALYGSGSFGAWNLRGGAAYAHHQIDTSRSIVFPGFLEQAKSRYGGGTAQVFGEVGYGIGLGQVAVEPFAGLAWVHVHTNGFRETGDIAALTGSGATQDVGYATMGARFATTFALVNGMALTPRAALAWQHAFNDLTPAVALTFQSTGVGFGISGVPLARDSALIEAGLDLRVTPQATLGVSYLGQVAGKVQDHAVKGQFTWRF